jgi:ABC-type sugar transport system ATPase subunit
VDGIRVRQIRKRFGNVRALDGVSLDVELGEVVAMTSSKTPSPLGVRLAS